MGKAMSALSSVKTAVGLAGAGVGDVFWVSPEIALIGVSDGRIVSVSVPKCALNGTPEDGVLAVVTEVRASKVGIVAVVGVEGTALWAAEDGSAGRGAAQLLPPGEGLQCALLGVAQRLWLGTRSGLSVVQVELISDSGSVVGPARWEPCASGVSMLCAAPEPAGAVLSGHEDGSVRLWTATTRGPEASRDVRPGVRVTSGLAFRADTWLGFADGLVSVLSGGFTGPAREWAAHAKGGRGVTGMAAACGELPGGRPLLTLEGAAGELCLWDAHRRADRVDERLGARLGEFTELVPATLRLATWNMYGKPPVAGDAELLLAGASENIVALSLQEIVPLNATSVLVANAKPLQDWEAACARALPGYKVVASRQLVGIALIVLVSEAFEPCVSQAEVAATKTGFNGLVGNKGGLTASFRVHDTLVSITACHLASGDAAVDQRNADFAAVLQGSAFTARPGLPGPAAARGTALLDHDAAFILGDLNYRISLPRGTVLSLIAGEDWKTLGVSDQLNKEKAREGGVWQGFTEGPLEFKPTYKLDPGTDTYDTSEKARTPAYTDRVLVRARPEAEAICLSYERISACTSSDHKPVISVYQIKSRLTDKAKKAQLSEALLKEETAKTTTA
jgi:hypothetical protein